MSKNIKSSNNISHIDELPCAQCMNYLSQDIKQRQNVQYKDKLEILHYLQHISDPRILKKIIILLKNLAQS